MGGGVAEQLDHWIANQADQGLSPLAGISKLGQFQLCINEHLAADRGGYI